MKGAVGLVAKNAVIAVVIAAIMAQYPIVLSVNITGITPLGGRAWSGGRCPKQSCYAALP